MSSSYDTDFFAWTQETARAIAAGRFEQIDRVALADEVESLGKRDRREIGSRLEVVLVHMLKAKYQPEKCTRSWHSSIITQRGRLQELLEESPSLAAPAEIRKTMERAYALARRKAAAETLLDESAFPVTCEWTIEEVMNG